MWAWELIVNRHFCEYQLSSRAYVIKKVVIPNTLKTLINSLLSEVGTPDEAQEWLPIQQSDDRHKAVALHSRLAHLKKHPHLKTSFDYLSEENDLISDEQFKQFDGWKSWKMQWFYSPYSCYLSCCKLRWVDVLRAIERRPMKSYKIFAIDPGTTHSGYCLLDNTGELREVGKVSNDEIIVKIAQL